MKTIGKLWIGLGILILLAPLGLIIPGVFQSGEAWGEWGRERIKGMLGYVPEGMERLAHLWQAPLTDYAFSNTTGSGMRVLSLQYIFSALLGILLAVSVIYLFAKFFIKDEK